MTAADRARPASAKRPGARVPRLRFLLPGAAVFAAAAVAVAWLAIGHGPPPALARNQRWRQDVAYLASEIPQVHVGGLLRVRPSAWQAAAARLEARVPRLTDGQIIVGMARIVAMLHDDETVVILPRRAFFPFSAAWIGGRLDLLSLPLGRRDLLGAQIVAIDGHPAGQVLGLIGGVIDHQDPTLQRDEEADYLTYDPALLQWLGLSRSPDVAAFTVRAADGARSVIRLSAVTRLRPGALASIPQALYLRDRDKPYWLRVLGGQRAVYLKYNQCLSDGGFQRLTAEAVAVLARNPSYRLIVDLRDNPGGDTSPFTPLINDLMTDPALHRRDRVFGLINSYTDSSATLDANSLSQVPNAVLIGQPPADPIDEYGNEATFRLPHSGIVVVYTTKAVNAAARALATPDLVVAPTIGQMLAGTDPVLDAALAYGR